MTKDVDFFKDRADNLNLIKRGLIKKFEAKGLKPAGHFTLSFSLEGPMKWSISCADYSMNELASLIQILIDYFPKNKVHIHADKNKVSVIFDSSNINTNNFVLVSFITTAYTLLFPKLAPVLLLSPTEGNC